MKNSILFYIIILIAPIFCFSQTIDSIDFISPFNDGLASIKKDNQWAFIDTEGTIVIDFKHDIIIPNMGHEDYPIFSNNRCLISQKKDGVTYFGYIDKTGSTVIKPQFLNATNFNDNIALAIELAKDTLGVNNVMKKPIVNYNYFEVIINNEGKIISYLTQKPKRIVLYKDFIKQPPKFTTKILSDNLMAVMDENKTWTIKKIFYLEQDTP